MFDIWKDGVRLGSLTPIGTGIIARDTDGMPVGQFADLAAAIARLLRVAS
jgi:hypothetical protein